MFHMEHCVFCAFLSPGTDRTNCGRPCDRHDVRLRDRVGMEHPLKADVGCRNTLFNAVPQSAAELVSDLLRRGARHFRAELLDQCPVRRSGRNCRPAAVSASHAARSRPTIELRVDARTSPQFRRCRIRMGGPDWKNEYIGYQSLLANV
jgi:hypothetical protein